MALARTALALAPFFLKGPTSRPGKRLAGLVFTVALITISIIFLLVAGFIAIMKAYGAEFGFLALGLTTLLMATVLYFGSRGHKVDPEEVERDMKADPIARFIPDGLQDDPRLQGLMEKIQEHPMGSAAAAVSLGFLVTNQFMGDEA